MSDFFVFYYAMGWVAEGVNYALLRNNYLVGRNPCWVASLLMWPILLPVYFAAWLWQLVADSVEFNHRDEYMWRRRR